MSDLTGKTCLVTGATSGIGKAVAGGLVTMGAAVIVHGRDTEKVKHLCTELSAAGGLVYPAVADFSVLDAVRDMADTINSRFDRLDVLVNNAGVLTDHRQKTADGFELTFGVNHLAPFLLTHKLQRLLLDNAPSRIVINSSTALGGGQIALDDLQAERSFGGWAAYANSKLANLLFSNVLAERLEDTGVVCNALCPGLIDTNLLKDNQEFGEPRLAQLRRNMRSPEEGAEILLFLAGAQEAKDYSGAFFLRSAGNGRQPVYPNWDRETANQLWDMSAALLSDWL